MLTSTRMVVEETLPRIPTVTVQTSPTLRLNSAHQVPEPLSSLPLQTPKPRSTPSVLKQTPTETALVTPRIDYQNGEFKGDEVDVKVEKGAVTIVAAGDQSYYLGEEIKFSGTNTESTNTYLFIIGPNLPANGGVLTMPKTAITPEVNLPADAGRWNSVIADVLADNTWSYKWGTSNVDLDAGTYTIYGVSKPYDKTPELLSKAAYGTVSIIIKKPFVSATASQSTVAQGDKIFITGTAEGQPTQLQSGYSVRTLQSNRRKL